ncbi:DUF4082 domain-containing protein [Saccharothrix sp. S26]|uniref:DUF4082 domain-containing protein n=1 Tax=Saccharothrix sp. S26 TaxID=2907215 RepID=UPI001F208D61|nr:DUF4082 domain-containing protein [Saccharothrix sp. S26]MCE6998422.1 DUF4082 domain-containing protein [Saccharothrix sp. S26]
MSRPARVLVAALIVVGGAVGLPGAAAAEPSYGPSVQLFTPTAGSHVEVGVPLQISGTSEYSEASHWDWAEISFDGGETWDYVDKPGPASNWQYFYTPTAEGDLGITTRGHDDGRTGLPRTTVVHVGGPSTASPARCAIECRPFVADVYPTVDADPSPVELGLVFQVDRPGTITHVEVTRPGRPLTPVRVRLWNSTGGVLADVTDVPVNGYGVPLPQNTRVVPGERYVVSYSTEGLPYRSTEWQFSGEVVSNPFRLPVSAGVYSYDGGFPTESWHHSSYGIVPVFTD